MSSSGPWLSVVIPTHNGERYLPHALESVRREPMEGVEVVVVDDGSTDATLAIVRKYEATLPIRTVPHERVGNWVATTNAGLLAARGRYACFLHQDDAWLEGRIAAVRRVVESEPQAPLVIHDAIFIGPGGETLGFWRCPLHPPGATSDEFMERLLVQNFIAIPSPVFDRAAALRFGGLDERLWYTADWDLWLRLGSEGPVRFLDQPLAAFRIHPGSQTMSRATTEREFREQSVVVLDRHFAAWRADASRRRAVRRAADFSILLNGQLAAVARGWRRDPIVHVASAFLALGPRGWHRYMRDSRIVERVMSRARMIRLRAA